MGVCTRRVNSDGCFFTFCVGQPNDTLRDGLIRKLEQFPFLMHLLSALIVQSVSVIYSEKCECLSAFAP
jgi:hypothetical protein